MNKHTKLYQDYVVFVESKSLRGRSKAEYLRQVRKLAEYYPSHSLKQLTERQVFDYLIFRRDEQKLRLSTLNQAVVALRMFYRDFLERDWQLWRQFEIRRDQPLPLVLTGMRCRGCKCVHIATGSSSGKSADSQRRIVCTSHA